MKLYVSSESYLAALGVARQLYLDVCDPYDVCDVAQIQFDAFNASLAVYTALQVDCNNAHMDGRDADYDSKRAILDEFKKMLLGCLKCLRDYLLGHVYQCYDGPSSLKFIFREYMKMTGLSASYVRGSRVDEVAKHVVNVLSYTSRLHLSVNMFPQRGLLKIPKTFNNVFKEFDIDSSDLGDFDSQAAQLNEWEATGSNSV